MPDYDNVNSWAFKEAKLILDRVNNSIPQKGYVLFETGYGPSGLPHIGTFGEVVRTNMVRKAFEYLSDIPTKLFCISDDMDALRKVPDNIPNKEKYSQYIGLPLTNISDPFEKCESYGDYMNSKLIEFLDNFNFEYEFISATKCYKSGKFNDYLIKVLEKYDDIIKIMLPTLGKDRQETYSPFLPICKKTGKVLQVKIIDKDVESHTITYTDEDGDIVTVSVYTEYHRLYMDEFEAQIAEFLKQENIDDKQFFLRCRTAQSRDAKAAHYLNVFLASIEYESFYELMVRMKQRRLLSEELSPPTSPTDVSKNMSRK